MPGSPTSSMILFYPKTFLSSCFCAGEIVLGKMTFHFTTRSPFFFVEPALETGIPSPDIRVSCPGWTIWRRISIEAGSDV